MKRWPIEHLRSHSPQKLSVTRMIKYRYTVPQKKTSQLIVCSVSVKYKEISIKIDRHILKETSNKTMQKITTLPKICASTTLETLNGQIEPSTQ